MSRLSDPFPAQKHSRWVCRAWMAHGPVEGEGLRVSWQLLGFCADVGSGKFK